MNVKIIKVLWTIFFAFLVLTYGRSIAYSFSENVSVTALYTVGTALNLVGLVAIFGLIRDRAYIQRRFWKIYFFVSLVWFLAIYLKFNYTVFAQLFLDAQVDDTPRTSLIASSIYASTVLVLKHFAYYLYAFNKNEIWESTGNLENER